MQIERMERNKAKNTHRRTSSKLDRPELEWRRGVDGGREWLEGSEWSGAEGVQGREGLEGMAEVRGGGEV